MNMQDIDYIKKHLGYELEMLLHSSVATKVFDDYDLGNVCSVTRDSIYVHTRNLHNFFCTDSRNDRHVNEFGTSIMDSPLSDDEVGALHSHVLHIKQKRNNSNNPVKLSGVALRFVDDMIDLWKKWIKTSPEEIQKVLVDILTESQRSAKKTESSLKKLKIK